MKRVLCMTAIAIFGMGSAMAASSFVWSSARAVDSVMVSSDGLEFVLSGAKIVSGSPCTNTFRITVRDPDYTDKKTAIEKAETNGYSVSVYHSSTSTACEVYATEVKMEG